MNEFRTLVKIGSVVFITFDNKPIPIAQSGGIGKIFSDAANQVARRNFRIIKYPRNHAACSRFAVCASYRNDRTITQDFFVQPLRSRGVIHAHVKHGINLVVRSAYGVAYQNDVRFVLQIIRMVPSKNLDILFSQHVTHGRIGIKVGPGHVVSKIPGQQSKVTHECPANSNNVQMCHWIDSVTGSTTSPNNCSTIRDTARLTPSARKKALPFDISMASRKMKAVIHSPQIPKGIATAANQKKLSD